MSDEEEVGDSVKMTEWNTRKAKDWQRGYKFAKKSPQRLVQQPVSPAGVVMFDLA